MSYNIQYTSCHFTEFRFFGTPVEPQIRTLTDRFVATVAAPSSGRLEIRDQKTKGLVLRISAGGAKSWSVLYRRRIDGRRRRCTLGQYPEVSLADARDAALATLARVSRDEDPARDRRRPTAAGGPMTFGDLADRYLTRHAERSKRSGLKDRQMLTKDVLPILRHEPLVSIRRADIADIVESIVDRGAPTQANRTFEVIRGMYNWALGTGLIESSPCLGLRAPAPERSRDRTLSTDEICRFWRGLSDAPMTWSVAQILRLCLVTGQRVSEVAGVYRAEVDFVTKEWRLAGHRVKNRVAHVVPLSALAVQLFAEAFHRTHHEEFAFANQATGKPITNQAVARAMSRSLNVLCLSDVTPHDLRRTAATGMARLGVSRLVIDKVLNHVSADRSTIAGVYDRYGYHKEKTAAMDVWGDHLISVVGKCNAEEFQEATTKQASYPR